MIKKEHIYNLSLIVYSLTVCFLSVSEIDPLKVSPFPYCDKFVHFFLYFFLAVIAKFCFQKNKNVYYLAWGYAFFLGFVLEIIQHYLPFRSYDWIDLISNGLGAFLGLIICYYFSKN